MGNTYNRRYVSNLLSIKMIDLLTGNFQITDRITVGRGVTFSDILKLVPMNETWDIKNGYRWIYLKGIEIEHLNFNIGLCFHGEKLFSILFGFTEATEKNESWGTWSEEHELQRKDIYEEWLTRFIGGRRVFYWGKIGAHYDPKSGSSSMYIQYR